MIREHRPALEIRNLTAVGLPSVRQALLDVYAEVYAGSLHTPFDSLEEFDRRLAAYAAAPGWECILAFDHDQPAGYAFGYPLQPATGWWRGLMTTVERHLLAETGSRTFALNEIMVRAPWRGTGIARSIHDELMARRTEERATLLVEQARPRVRQRYQEWGYTWMGSLRPDVPHAPVFDALTLPLHR